MGRIINIVKTVYGKIDWFEVRKRLLKYVKTIITIKENDLKEKYIYDIVDIKKETNQSQR